MAAAHNGIVPGTKAPVCAAGAKVIPFEIDNEKKAPDPASNGNKTRFGTPDGIRPDLIHIGAKSTAGVPNLNKPTSNGDR